MQKWIALVTHTQGPRQKQMQKQLKIKLRTTTKINGQINANDFWTVHCAIVPNWKQCAVGHVCVGERKEFEHNQHVCATRWLGFANIHSAKTKVRQRNLSRCSIGPRHFFRCLQKTNRAFVWSVLYGIIKCMRYTSDSNVLFRYNENWMHSFQATISQVSHSIKFEFLMHRKKWQGLPHICKMW